MLTLWLILGIPALAAVLLAAVPSYRVGAAINVLASLATFIASLRLFTEERLAPSPYFVIDDFNIYLLALTTFVAFTTSLFSSGYIRHEIETGRLQSPHLRFYHAMYQAFLFTMMLAFTANSLGLMWVAVEGATLATVMMIGLYRTPAALEASWKYFILCGVGIALALFGTTLLYLAAQPVVGTGLPAMTWSTLLPKVAECNPMLLNIAFVFLLVGYGTKVGLVPLHAWLPDAHAEGPTPISAVLSGLLLNVAMYVLLRFKMLMAGNAGVMAPGPLLVFVGLASLCFAAFMLYKQKDIKRMFAYSSIEHMGIIAFAFGMGGPLANFAGLLHMTMHSLTKSAIFYSVGYVSQVKGTQQMNRIHGLTTTHPLLGWALVLGVVAIVGLPPFGVFLSEFLVVTSTFAREPVLAILLVLGLLLSLAALMQRLQGLAFGSGAEDAPGAPDTHGAPNAQAAVNAQAEAGAHHEDVHPLRLLPLFVHLALVLVAGLFLPTPLVSWFQNVAKLLG